MVEVLVVNRPAVKFIKGRRLVVSPDSKGRFKLTSPLGRQALAIGDSQEELAKWAIKAGAKQVELIG